MKRYTLELVLVVLTASLALHVARQLERANTPVIPMHAPPAATMKARLSPSEVTSAETRLVNRNPFRLSRSPSRNKPQDAAQPTTIAADPTRPTLLVRAIIGGPPWSALLEGIPQTSGAVVVREGETHGTLVITAISRDTVVVSAADVVWKLALAKSSQ